MDMLNLQNYSLYEIRLSTEMPDSKKGEPKIIVRSGFIRLTQNMNNPSLRLLNVALTLMRKAMPSADLFQEDDGSSCHVVYKLRNVYLTPEMLYGMLSQALHTWQKCVSEARDIVSIDIALEKGRDGKPLTE